MKTPWVFSVWSIWAFINSAKHRHLEFLLLILWRKKITYCPPAAFRASSESRVCKQPIFHSIILLLPLMLTGNAKSAQKNAPTRNVYVTLVYLFLFVVALLCCDMLWYSWSGQCWSNLHWSAPHYALLTFVDITALPGFLYLYTCFLTPNHNFYSFPTDLRDLMTINS